MGEQGASPGPPCRAAFAAVRPSVPQFGVHHELPGSGEQLRGSARPRSPIVHAIDVQPEIRLRRDSDRRRRSEARSANRLKSPPEGIQGLRGRPRRGQSAPRTQDRERSRFWWSASRFLINVAHSLKPAHRVSFVKSVFHTLVVLKGFDTGFVFRRKDVWILRQRPGHCARAIRSLRSFEIILIV